MEYIVITEKDTDDQDYFYNHIVKIDGSVSVDDILERATEIYQDDDRDPNIENPTMCLEKAIEEFEGVEVAFTQYEWLA